MTDLTRELERTRNGAKIMERTLEAAAGRIKELEDALRPFAKEAKEWDAIIAASNIPRIANLDESPANAKFTVGDLRRAAALLEKS